MCIIVLKSVSYFPIMRVNYHDKSYARNRKQPLPTMATGRKVRNFIVN
jgi:hypothetical protein